MAGYLQVESYSDGGQRMAREALPGTPFTAEKVQNLSEIIPGDHIVYQVADLPYRPVFRSALVLGLCTTPGQIQSVTNVKNGGIKRQNVSYLSLKSLHKIIYAPACQYSNDEAIQRARRRLKMNENRFHSLYNHSHFFVTLVKTGRENPLTEIIESLISQCEGVYTGNDILKPVLKKVEIQSLAQIRRGDHIVQSSQHWLVAEISGDSFQAYSSDGEVIFKGLQWRKETYRLEYAENTSQSTQPVESAHREHQRKSKWTSSEQFVTSMKCGRGYLFDETSVISAENVHPVSCTCITPDVAIDEGDHLVVKADDGTYRSILALRCIGRSTVYAITGLDPNDTHQCINIFENEVHRVNYKQHLSNREVLERAESIQGSQLLQRSLRDMSIFVTWAKTGTSTSLRSSINRLVQQQQIKQVQPILYRKIISLDEVEVGDHLFQHFVGYRWHFMVTEKNVDPSDHTRMRTISSLRGSVSEDIEQVNPTTKPTYRIEYPEQLPSDVAIERARSKLGVNFKAVSPLARMWFVRWAKTGSEEGMEVDFMTNTSMPVSKSRIWTFSQLEPGDYLVEDPGRFLPFCHYIVKSVESPTRCTVIGSWYGDVKQLTLNINAQEIDSNDIEYYRMNYNPGECLPASMSIHKAELILFMSSVWVGKSSGFANFVKTTDEKKVKVKTLKDDRILLRREAVTSVMMLMPGDHIECELDISEKKYKTASTFIGDAFHHMFVTDINRANDSVQVIHFGSSDTGPSSSKPNINQGWRNLSDCRNLSRIIYTDRVLPRDGHEYLRSQIAHREIESYCFLNNNCEHLVTLATTGHKISIQVDKKLRAALQLSQSGVQAMVKNTSLRAPVDNSIRSATIATAGRLVARAAAGSTARAVGEGTAEASAPAAAVFAFRLGYSAAFSGTAVGIVSGVAAGVNILIEGPLLAHSVYKLHRKKKFNMISSNDYKQGIVRESFASANTVIGGTAGAIVGQVAIPVPVLGAAVGGFTGAVLGRLAGYGEGWAISRLLREKNFTLPSIVVWEYFSHTQEPVANSSRRYNRMN